MWIGEKDETILKLNLINKLVNLELGSGSQTAEGMDWISEEFFSQSFEKAYMGAPELTGERKPWVLGAGCHKP